jgi:hypothetical protein
MSDWYFSHDGTQHGPVPYSELERLAENGEFDPADDLVWREGMNDWKPAGSVEELKALAGEVHDQSEPEDRFSDETLARRENPYATPATRPEPETSAERNQLPEIEPGAEPIQIGAITAWGFELTKRHFGPILGIGLLMVGISLAATMIMGLFDQMAGYAPTEPADFGDATGNQTIDGIVAKALGGGSWINIIVTFIVDVFLWLGIIRVGLNIIDGRPYLISTLFSQGRLTISGCAGELLFTLMVAVPPVAFVSLTAASGSVGTTVVAGLAGAVISIYLALRFGQYKHAIVDRQFNALGAFGYSSRITRGNRPMLLVLFIVILLINVAGALALLVGLLFTIPMTTIMALLGYRWLQHGAAVTRDPRLDVEE